MRLVLVALVAACGAHNGNAGDGHGSGSDGGDGPYTDFPIDPIVDTGAPNNSPGLFGAPGSGAPSGGPCMVEPEVGTLYPQNWLRPRFSWLATGSENLFELRLTAGNQTNPLVVYTTATAWTMPAAIWTALAAHTIEQPIMVSVRGATLSGAALASGPELGSSGNIAVAAARAPGAIVYWTTSSGTLLRGFHIGEETVHDIVKPADDGSSTQCVGCHTSTPDGTYVAYAASANAGNGDPATLGLLSADGTKQRPSFITASAQTLMARTGQELPSFSPLHWQSGDHVAIGTYPISTAFQIIWTDLEASSTTQGSGWGVIARNGDGNAAAYASFARTQDTILYVSGPDVTTGVTTAHGNLMTVPYAARAGGTATAIAGAATTAYNEYYPTWSSDDRYVAFNRVPDGQSSYANTNAEVFVIPAAGGTPLRLTANDPPTCSGKTSPGIENSWPKWAPETTDVGSKRYYWLTFSSTRIGGAPQLFVTPVVDDGGSLTSYPALYLWNQPAGDHNHTPAWDNFSIVQ